MRRVRIGLRLQPTLVAGTTRTIVQKAAPIALGIAGTADVDTDERDGEDSMSDAHDDAEGFSLEDMGHHAVQLAAALAPYDKAASSLPSDHPYHGLKKIHGELCDKIARIAASQKRKRVPDNPAQSEMESATYQGNEYEPHEPRPGDSAADPRGQEGSQVDTGLRKRAFDDAIQVRAEQMAPVWGCTVEKAYSRIYESEHIRAIKNVSSPRHDPGPAESDDQRDAWEQIEKAATALQGLTKSASGRPLTHEQAIDRVLNTRTDLVKRYRGISADPLGDRTR
jgi:hypothetical protein